MLTFEVQAQAGQARAAQLQTPRGIIQTPIFMPVGTQGTVKAMSPEELKELGAQIILGNTYHLHLRPGDELVRELGQLHRFMNWPYPILTDSGGFQVFSLGKLKKQSEEGVVFQSHLDGATVVLNPERSIQIQQNLGADIMMCFDECLALPATYEQVQASVARTHRWSARSKAARTTEQALFGIVQGGLYLDLRRQSLEGLLEIGFDGYALGGLSVGESKEELYATTRAVAPWLPAERPRYLMGVGEPEDLLEAIASGIDMFDCVLPTRNARNGGLFTSLGKLSIKQAAHRTAEDPLDPHCECYVCRHYSRAYLRHLYLAQEILSMRLNTYHNLYFFLNLVRQARQAIFEQRFESFHREFLGRYRSRLEVLPEEE